MHFNNFAKGGVEGVVNFWRGNSEFLEIVTINFSSRLLFDLLSTYRLKDLYHLLFYSYIFSLFCFIKSFLNSVLLLIGYLIINRLFKRKSL